MANGFFREAIFCSWKRTFPDKASSLCFLCSSFMLGKNILSHGWQIPLLVSLKIIKIYHYQLLSLFRILEFRLKSSFITYFLQPVTILHTTSTSTRMLLWKVFKTIVSFYRPLKFWRTILVYSTVLCIILRSLRITSRCFATKMQFFECGYVTK